MSSFTYDLMNLLVDSGLAEHLATAFETDLQTVKDVLLEFSPETKKTVKTAVKKTSKKEKTATKAKKAPEKPVNLSKLTISQLKELCTEKGLSSDGKKADLITRLEKGEKKTEKPATKKAAAKPVSKTAAKKKVKKDSESEEKPKKGKATSVVSKSKASTKSKKEELEEEPVPEEVDGAEGEETFPAKDYPKLSIAELKGLLDARGLPKTGKKNELIERLEWDDLDTEIDADPEDGPGNTQPVEEEVTVEEVDAQEDVTEEEE